MFSRQRTKCLTTDINECKLQHTYGHVNHTDIPEQKFIAHMHSSFEMSPSNQPQSAFYLL